MQAFSFSKRPRIIANLLGWVGIGVLVLQGVFPGLVVCFGDTSHVAVESAYTNVHDTPLQAYGEFYGHVSLLSIHHDDYPLVAVAINEPLQRFTPVFEPFLSSLPQSLDVPPFSIGPRLVAAAHSPQVFLRTVILRI